MLIGLPEALAFAERRQVALAAVNVPFFEALLAVIKVAEATRTPVILQHAEVHEHLMSIEDIGPVMRVLAERSSAPFVLHVDHASSAEYVARGFEVGFNSAMIDGSSLPFEENVALTSQVVALARERGFGIEGELGVMTGNENGNPSQGVADASLYTDPKQAREFVARTGVTALAASFGTVHGLYRRKPELNYELISQLRAATGVPLVMHGGSGLSAPEYRACIHHGVRKVNYYTYAAKAALDAARDELANPDTVLFPDMALAAQQAVTIDVASLVEVLRAPADPVAV
ncbi:MAG TPA: ketose-bisphosphate aldolase [Propionibacteriaceae bacterium]|nr:ketose-bisphosphate aldolase [Propionibacteriaceae bacterium]